MIVFVLVFGWCLHIVDFVPTNLHLCTPLFWTDGIEQKDGGEATQVLKIKFVWPITRLLSMEPVPGGQATGCSSFSVID